MKKIIILALTLLMAFQLVSCGGAGGKEEIGVRDANKAIPGAAAINETVKFGYYEQDNDETNGKEPIEWLVLKNDGEKILLVSKYVLDVCQYNQTSDKTTYDNSYLRSWLNNDFLNGAFTAEQQAYIVETEVAADYNPEYEHIMAGYNTKDKVFVFSAAEATKFYSTDAQRICKATLYAAARGCAVNGEGSFWWLRTPGGSTSYATAVKDAGVVDFFGYAVDTANYGVRPVIWLKLDK